MRRLYSRLGLLLAMTAGTSACTLELVDTFGVAGQELAGETGAVESTGSTGAGELGLDEGGDEGGGAGLPLFDVGGGGEFEVDSCDFAAEFPSHIGCEFIGIDVDGPGLFDYEPFGFVVINPLSKPVTVRLERYSDGLWLLVSEVVVAGEDEYAFLPFNNQAVGTGIHSGATVRLTSDQPIIVVQAHPAAGSAVSSSATMLQPTTAWSTRTPVAGWRTHLGVGERAYLAVVARTTGTTVTLRPTFAIDNPPVDWIDDWMDVDNDGTEELILPIEPGELLRLDAVAIDAAEVDHGTSGSVVDSGQEHLTSAFSAHTCASIPDYNGSCGHMQEQLSAALVGTRFVAPRLIASKNPGANPDPNPSAPLVHERTMVQVVATEPETKVVFSYDVAGQGVELETVIIDPDEPYAVYESEHDLAVVADKPVVVAGYMTNADSTKLGSPSMVQLAPVEQWTGHHWVWVPEGFETQLLVGTSPQASVAVLGLSGLAGAQPPPAGEELEVVEISSTQPGPSWVVHRIAVGPGIHRVDSSGASSVIVAGWREADGFAYLGGWGPSFADLGPEG